MMQKDRYKLLLIEDNPGDAELTTNAFLSGDVVSNVEVFSDGESALNYLRYVESSEKVSRPDLILLDLNIPKKNGLDVLKELKKMRI